MPFLYPGEMGHFSKAQCGFLLEMGLDEPQGKRKGYVCVCI